MAVPSKTAMVPIDIVPPKRSLVFIDQPFLCFGLYKTLNTRLVHQPDRKWNEERGNGVNRVSIYCDRADGVFTGQVPST